MWRRSCDCCCHVASVLLAKIFYFPLHNNNSLYDLKSLKCVFKCNHKAIHAYYYRLTSAPAYWREWRRPQLHSIGTSWDKKWKRSGSGVRRLFVRGGCNHQFWSGSGYVMVTYLSSITGTAVARQSQVLCSCAGVPNNCHNIVNSSDKLSAVTPLELSTGLRKISRLLTMFKRPFSIVS